MLYEQLPATARRHQPTEGSFREIADQQGPEGGATAPSGPNQFPSALGSHQAQPPSASPAEGVTFAGVPVKAMEDVMAERTRQIVEFGHTAEADRETPLWAHREFTELGRRSFMRMIADHLSSAIEYASFGRGKHARARRYLVMTAALCLAAIDRIDAEDEANPLP